MALGTTLSLVVEPDGSLQKTIPVSQTSKWITCIDATGADDADANPITDPTAEITAATRKLIDKKGDRGTHLRFRLVYDDGISAITAPKLAVFGRTGTQQWQRLVTKGGSTQVTLTPDTTNDCSDGTLNYTTPLLNDHTVDTDGCDQFLVGIETALAATGTVTTAYVEVKII